MLFNNWSYNLETSSPDFELVVPKNAVSLLILDRKLSLVISRFIYILNLWKRSKFLSLIYFFDCDEESSIADILWCRWARLAFYFIIYSASLSPFSYFYWILRSAFLASLWIASSYANLIDFDIVFVFVRNFLEAEAERSILSSSFCFLNLLFLLLESSSDKLAYSNIYS